MFHFIPYLCSKLTEAESKRLIKVDIRYIPYNSVPIIHLQKLQHKLNSMKL